MRFVDQHDRERGAATTVTVLLLTPVLTLMLFAAFQAGLWNHARTQVRVQARATASLVARSGANPDDAAVDALVALAERTDVRNAGVAIDVVDDMVTVRISGSAPGILIGTSTYVSVEVRLPVEGWTPL